MKRLHVGLAAAVAVALLNGTAGAQTAPQFAVSQSGDEVVLTVTDGAVRFVEALTPATFAFTIASGHDTVRVEGSESGALRVTRGDRSHALHIQSLTADQLRDARVLLAGGEAPDALAALVASARAADSRYAPVLQSAYALLRMVQGYGAATIDLATELAAQRPPSLVTVAQRMRPDECYDGWRRSVVRYFNELDGCLAEARSRWWEAWRPAYCAGEFDVKAVLAAYWLLACNGIG